MLRRKAEDYLDNWKKNRNTALLVTGARQVGKTFSIERFGEKAFPNFIEISFVARADLIDAFAQIRSVDQFLVRLSAIAGDKMAEGKTLIFFDEIQLLYARRDELRKAGKLDPSGVDLLTILKPLVEEGNYRFIVSGSLLGVTIKDIALYPAGYLDILRMYPLDFEEYLWSKGVGEKALAHLRECYERKEAVDESLNSLFLSHFREYVLIGGMPRAVSEFLDSRNLYNVSLSQKAVIEAYMKDIVTYIEEDEKKLRVREIYRALPSELNNNNKRFVSSHVVSLNYLKRNSLEDEYLWLSAAGIAIPVYNVTEGKIPLKISSQRKVLKLFMNDVGLLTYSLLDTGIREKLLDGEKEINFGAPYENAVAQELLSKGNEDKLYYYSSKKNGEVDFLLEGKDGEVLPIEIKSGKAEMTGFYNHKALDNFVKAYSIKEAYVFGEGNVKRESEVITDFPIYMVAFLGE